LDGQRAGQKVLWDGEARPKTRKTDIWKGRIGRGKLRLILLREIVKGGHGTLKKIIAAGTSLVCGYAFLSHLAKKGDEGERIKDGNGYIEDGAVSYKPSLYEGYMKPLFDKGLSFLGLVMLAPVYGIIALAIYMDDPGPVIFKQKRVGKGGRYFELHKFRSMKSSAPHDTPTHQLKDPEQYITKVGKVLRKTSLDELPQIWDIFRGKMSVIGPRPALWNQDDLVAEREKYGANDILPGLTGLAQIKGRDELEIRDKARLDGQYANKLREGGMGAFIQDAGCFIGTVGAVFRHDGVVEGGTGYLHGDGSMDGEPMGALEAGTGDYGCKKKFDIDVNIRKRVLITGAGSYIGGSFAAYAKQNYPNIETYTLDLVDRGWKDFDFSGFDAVFHVAGIAHADIGSVTDKEREQYYAVNRDLAIEVSKAAKEAGVGQFVFMSSMIIYGALAPYGKSKVVDEYTAPSPDNFYGDSKWQADQGVRGLASPDFHVAVIRAPMVYGCGAKGNYAVLRKIAKKTPVFPDVENQRSMLHINNLCEFLCLLVCSGEGGIYFPQNAGYTKTARMVEQIGAVNGRRVITTRLLNPLVGLAAHIPGKVGGLANKAFGNCVYSQEVSEYDGLEYRVVGFEESIVITEA